MLLYMYLILTNAKTTNTHRPISFQAYNGEKFQGCLAVLFVGFVVYAYCAMQPPRSKICGTPNGPSVTSPRIKHCDGRYLAYKEHGVPRDQEV
ncbi:hypothetical protein KY290_036968 [Solanum tuberosum]|uniref:Uncharacterized protein n=1 Tax=Solanum tuberosum TaxID=4113 RepID=A0ABQ7TVP2_SOLTU|nr:hypothetical protein KY289_036458 [Solanum tuberosum]KAH0738263.1 hypothetical protein KY290_036968 [Solanum tuberosum]